MTDIPPHILEQAREVARLFVHPTAWTYEPSCEERRRAEVDFERRLRSAAYLLGPAILAAEQRGAEEGRVAERKRCLGHVYGLAGSDNAAERVASAIRSGT